jgi:hypothetical protein
MTLPATIFSATPGAPHSHTGTSQTSIRQRPNKPLRYFVQLTEHIFIGLVQCAYASLIASWGVGPSPLQNPLSVVLHTATHHIVVRHFRPHFGPRPHNSPASAMEAQAKITNRERQTIMLRR